MKLFGGPKTWLYEAAEEGDEKRVMRYLVEGEKSHFRDIRDMINFRDSYNGETALYVAAEKGYSTIVLLLLQAGAAIDLQDNEKKSALYVAAQNGHKHVVGRLLRDNAKQLCDCVGWSPLHIAVLHGHIDIVRLLLEKGADVNWQAGLGISALHLAASAGRFCLSCDNNETCGCRIAMAQLLLDKGAKIDLRDYCGRSALQSAVRYGRVEVVRLLLDRGAKIDWCDKEGMTALDRAKFHKRTDIVDLLVERGAVDSSVPVEPEENTIRMKLA